MSGTTPNLDAILTDVIPTSGDTPVEWSRGFAEDGLASWLADGSIALTIWSSTDAAAMYQLSGPGQEKKIGPLAHVSNIVSVSRDLQRATLSWREYRGEAPAQRSASDEGRDRDRSGGGTCHPERSEGSRSSWQRTLSS